DAAYSDCSYAYVQSGNENKVIVSSSFLTNHIEAVAKQEGIEIVKGNVYSTDVFYNQNTDIGKLVNDYKCIGTEMEAFALFHNAKIFDKEAACILTVSDSLITKDAITSEQREKSFVKMVELALKSL
ncbi:MAG: purine nucleoside phosphorylase DeoD-type, partial [Bacilli bacterium]|nr:purine nucleoside phosphorylase DeoD-type [Bacilli bacterium]